MASSVRAHPDSTPLLAHAGDRLVEWAPEEDRPPGPARPGDRRHRSLRLPEGAAPHRGAAPRAGAPARARRRGPAEVGDRRLLHRGRHGCGRRPRDDGRVPRHPAPLHRRHDGGRLVVRVPRAARGRGDPRRALRHGARDLRLRLSLAHGPHARHRRHVPRRARGGADAVRGALRQLARRQLCAGRAPPHARVRHDVGAARRDRRGRARVRGPEPARALPRSDHGGGRARVAPGRRPAAQARLLRDLRRRRRASS